MMKSKHLWLLALAIFIVIISLVACDATDTASTDISDTPTATPTMQQMIEQAVPGDGVGGSLTFKYNPDTNTITVKDDVGELDDQTTCKSAVFNIQQYIWQSDLNPDEVDVTVVGAVVDKYGREFTDKLLSANLTNSTAHKFVWDNLDYDSAWKAYDSTWISQILSS